MRLIDADALMYSRVRIAHDDGTIGGYNAVVMSSVINNSPTVEAIPIKWLESFKPLMTKDAYWGIKEAISQWNGDHEIIDEARRCIDRAFRKVMR